MNWNGDIASLRNELESGGWSCVIGKNSEMRTFSKRGVADLYYLLKSEPDFLYNSYIADKVVGKGAAALMVLGKISRLYTRIISTPALRLLQNSGITVEYDTEVEYIVNRSKTGRCPVETLCDGIESPSAMLPLIDEFMLLQKTKG